MDLTILAGKGGVGKSTISGACAINKSFSAKGTNNSEKVLIMDYDKGHSVTAVLADFEKKDDLKKFDPKQIGDNKLNLKRYESNKIHNMNMRDQNLSIAVIEEVPFIEFPIYVNREGMGISGYLKQFSGDYGAVPYADMLSTFFGTSEYPPDVSKFASLVKVYNDALEQKFDRVIMDIEPTGGLERLLSQATRIAYGRKNIIDSRFSTLKTLFAKWPYPKAFLEGEYMQNIEHYTQRINNLITGLKSAQYLIVTHPKAGPVEQIVTVEKIIEKYDAKVHGYVINHIEGRHHEQEQINRVKKMSNGKPVVEIEYNTKLCAVIDDKNIFIDQTHVNNRRASLYDIGRKFSSILARQSVAK